MRSDTRFALDSMSSDLEVLSACVLLPIAIVEVYKSFVRARLRPMAA